MHTRRISKYDLWPYKRRNTGGSITKIYGLVDYTKLHLRSKFEQNPVKNVVYKADTLHPKKYGPFPYRKTEHLGQHCQKL